MHAVYIERTHQEGCGRDDGGALYHAQSPQVVLAERERVAVVDSPHVLTAVPCALVLSTSTRSRHGGRRHTELAGLLLRRAIDTGMLRDVTASLTGSHLARRPCRPPHVCLVTVPACCPHTPLYTVHVMSNKTV